MILVECQRRYEFMIIPQQKVWKEMNAQIQLYIVNVIEQHSFKNLVFARNDMLTKKTIKS